MNLMNTSGGCRPRRYSVAGRRNCCHCASTPVSRPIAPDGAVDGRRLHAWYVRRLRNVRRAASCGERSIYPRGCAPEPHGLDGRIYMRWKTVLLVRVNFSI